MISETIRKENTKKAMTFFYHQGFSVIQAAAICGNLMQESGIDPASAEHDSDTGFGIARWTWPPRKRALFDFLGKRNLKRDSLDGQLLFLLEEYNSKAFANFRRKFQFADTIAEATTLFCNEFERPGKPMLQNRIRYATEIYNQWIYDTSEEEE